MTPEKGETLSSEPPSQVDENWVKVARLLNQETSVEEQQETLTAIIEGQIYPLPSNTVGTLIALLVNAGEDSNVRRLSAVALGIIGDPSAGNALRWMMSEPIEGSLRVAVENALLRMGIEPPSTLATQSQAVTATESAL